MAVMTKRAVLAGLGIVCAISLSIPMVLAYRQDPPTANYDESKVGTYTLPDPLIFTDGKPVKSARDWTRRRPELLRLFEQNMFGARPAAPGKLVYDVFDTDRNAFGGKAIRKQIDIYFSDNKSGPKESVLLYIPASAPKPVPVILTLSFSVNQTAANDPNIRAGTMWNSRTKEKQEPPADLRGRGQAETERVLARGYAYATVCYTDIEPDFNGGYPHGIRPLFVKPGQDGPGPGEWGAIGAWSYGMSRVMDYLEKDGDVNARKVALLGHSRLGKTALWTGAQDPRFAVILSSCSGEGGASLQRRNYGETVKDLIARFPYWFCKNYEKFKDQWDKLPVDAHELIALNAPRPVYITGAEDDKWADPKGEFLACVAAGPVYKVLGASDLGTSQMPGLNQPIMKTLAYHYRTGKHAVTDYDWEQFLKFADMHLKK